MTNDSWVLILSDELESVAVWTHGLRRQGISCRSLQVGKGSPSSQDLDRCGVVLVDMYDDNAHVTQICERVRANFGGPILLLTYERDERYHIHAYEAGVDECIVKPISMSLLLAKVVSWLRRIVPLYDDHEGEMGADFSYDHRRRVLITPDGCAVRLSKLEGRLVSCFINHPGSVLGPDTITEHVWTNGSRPDSRMLKNLVYRFRQKIEPEPNRPRYFQTILGEGYCFSVAEK